MEFLRFIDIAGIAAFSIAGAFAAMEKKLDFFGIFVIAFVTALGGGTLRDVLIGEVPVRWMTDLRPGMIVLISTIAAMLFTKAIKNFNKILLLFDSIGLGFFTVLGIQTGIVLGLHPVICISLGTITACFGGVIRDISLNNIPLIFQKEIYATTCILGGALFFLLQMREMQKMPLEIICITTIVMLRLLAVKFNWQLPAIRKLETP
ncbi:MAG: trimeric intracellular cation channel family protein [Ignavibacteria bacterium]|nr:trimeric intracellular cation channel family protein [Ignavibacteria bacterium]